MKKTLLLSLSAMLSCSLLCAQTPKFGKVTEEELAMTVYDKDPDAAAVVLYEDTYLWYQITDRVQRVWDYRTRIKILKPEGTTCADVSIPYVSTFKGDETVASLEAVAYNLVNGKVVKTPLKRSYIFREQLDDKRKVLKFSIPEVRPGTVIEYRYRKMSDYITYIPSFVFQHDIPVRYSRSEASIPEFFRFNRNMKGYLHVDVEESTANDSFPLQNGSTDSYPYELRRIVCEIRDVPALKKEPYVWCLNDYRSMLEFELSQIALPYTTVKSYTTSWEKVNETLAKSEFDAHMKIGNPFKDEVAAIRGRGGSPAQTAHDVLKTVQSKMKWNGRYRLFSDGPRAAANKGTGSSADINFILMAALKDAGFGVVPILLNPRRLGRLPFTHATIDRINTFVLMVDPGDGKPFYMDGTNPHSDLNLLPTELMADRARIYGVDGEAGWCDLTAISPSAHAITMMLRFAEDGSVTGTVVENLTGQAALELSEKYETAKTEAEFVADRERENEVRMENFRLEGQGTPKLRMTYDLALDPTRSGEHIYLNATLVPFMSENRLHAQTRLLPVEFPYPITCNIRCTLELPEGYTVEELPKNISMAACNQGVTCRYIAQQTGNALQFNFTFGLRRIVYPTAEFPDLNTFYGMVTDLSNSRIVLKKP